MASSSAYTSSPVAKWRSARRLYPIYCALSAQFALDKPPYDDLDEASAKHDPDFLARVQTWFDAIDAGLHVAQFRQMLQGTAVASSEDKLQVLIERHYTKPEKTDADRDKLDFLLVQYFAVCSPPGLSDEELTLDNAAEVLAPVLGATTGESPEWLRPLDGWLEVLPRFTSLQDLQTSQLVQQGRQLKASARQLYFAPAALVAFTRFSYLLRRTFYRLINAELKAIAAVLEQLACHGLEMLDCSPAQMSPTTSLAELQHFCETYKKPALPEYSVDTSILRLIQLRQIVEGALAEIERPDDPVLSQIEAHCRRVEAELAAMRKLAATLAAERRRSIPAGKSTAADASPFEEVLEIPVEVPLEAAPKTGASAAAGDKVLDLSPPVPAPTAAPAPPAPVAVSSPAPIPTPPPAPAGIAAPPSSATVEPSLANAMEEIRRKLSAAPRKGISSLNIAGTALLLSPDEVEAFIRPKDDSSVDLQRSLAARALLLQAVEMQKRTASPELLARTIELCRTEAANIQQHSANAKAASNTANAVTLNASASQLLSLLRQVERMTKPS